MNIYIHIIYHNLHIYEIEDIRIYLVDHLKRSSTPVNHIDMPTSGHRSSPGSGWPLV